ncbi:AOSL-like protein [Mya arenaria]|uniref:AOSL-like protein n=1 Tax=Mya arenaria TaxID=6604 RepID=A0ABY7DTD0_MYAAR|nr:AOSL-like protein [Mya arenaria]
MENGMTSETTDYVVLVRTGDRKRAGTDANIRIIFHDNQGKKTDKIRLHHVFKNDFECGNIDEFVIQKQANLTTVDKVELWRDNFGFGSRWYCDYIIIRKKDSDTEYSFPVFRWIKADVHYIFRLNDTMLPQQDPMAEQRWKELQKKKKKYHPSQFKLNIYMV